MTNTPKKTESVNVFHRWQAKLNGEKREIEFFVSKKYALSNDDVELIDPADSTSWDKVLVLPFPAENLTNVEDKAMTSAGEPSYFDVTQLNKRYIQIDEFVRLVSDLLNNINEDLEKAAALEQLSDESDWALL